MTALANPVRGEIGLALGSVRYVLRPTFDALVKAEVEAGSLLHLAQQAVAGSATLMQCEALLWHCLAAPHEDRGLFRAQLVAAGLTAALPAVRAILTQMLAGHDA